MNLNRATPISQADISKYLSTTKVPEGQCIAFSNNSKFKQNRSIFYPVLVLPNFWSRSELFEIGFGPVRLNEGGILNRTKNCISEYQLNVQIKKHDLSDHTAGTQCKRHYNRGSI